jgi:hypothetical protein
LLKNRTVEPRSSIADQDIQVAEFNIYLMEELFDLLDFPTLALTSRAGRPKERIFSTVSSAGRRLRK